MTELTLQSPDQRLRVSFALSSAGAPTYRASYDDAPILLDSQLGLELAGAPLLDGFALAESCDSQQRGDWQPLYGERARIPDNYNALTLTLRQAAATGRTLQINLRAYNEGLAFQYHIPQQDGLTDFTISTERSQFHFPPGCHAYAEQGAEGEYADLPIAQIGQDCERPLTVVYPDGHYACLTEAAQNDYARMLLRTSSASPQIVESQLSGLITHYTGYGNMASDLPPAQAGARVAAQAPFSSPWRVLIIGERPGDLLERNYLVLNLAAPCALPDTSWIQPGKVLRDMTVSTPGGKACVDFAAQHGIQYVLIDAGWYGDPFDDASDATQVADPIWFWGGRHDPDHPGLDIPDLVRYAEARGVGIMLYVDRRHVERQLEQILPRYKAWGVRAIKFGFVNTGPQFWTRWLVDAVRKCGEFGIALNIHDAYRPSGLSRTFPHLLTQEGIRGNEHMPSARHNATLPFTRFVAGAADYTICYYTDRKQTTFPHQLAMAIVTYSPLNTIFWYDRPSDWHGEAEIDFFARMPTVWDDTRVLDGAIGEFAVIARRSGDAWFLGCITNEQAREIRIPLAFLEPGRTYTAQIYADGFGQGSPRTDVLARQQEVDASGQLTISMAPSGGQALYLLPR